jgi:parvulin-like peptidyl-prolyl isomerase
MQVPPFFHPDRAGKTSANQEKKTLKKIRVPLIAVFLMTSLFSCAEKKEATQKTDNDVQVKILATVNGVPITEYDVKQHLKRVVHGEKPNPEATQNILEILIRDELIYQQSLDLGLDKNPEYRRKLNNAEAQLRALQRQDISNLYREYIKTKAVVTDSEAKEYFEKNSKKIQTKFHIWQIYYKGDEARITEDYKDLKSGKSFEKVASRRFPVLPKGMNAPWDLGYLYWSQIPASWQGTIDRLEPGKVSDIIKGPNERFWVIKLVDTSVDPKITFDTEKGRIVEILRKQKADELSETMLSQMRTKSKIIFPK